MLLYSLNRFYVLCVYCIYSSYQQSLCVLCNLDMVWSWSSFSVEKKKNKEKKKKSLALLPHSHPIPLLLYSLFSLHIILSFCTYCILLCGLIGRIWPAAMWWDVKMIIYLSIYKPFSQTVDRFKNRSAKRFINRSVKQINRFINRSAKRLTGLKTVQPTNGTVYKPFSQQIGRFLNF